MKDAKLIELFRRLTRTAIWEQQAGVALQFDNHHPQGLVRIGDLFYLSSVELIERPVTLGQPSEGYDRTPGRGVGHVFIFDNSGRLKGDIVLGEGAMYHPGGIDYDGRHIWVSVAEYRPHSRSIIYKVNPATRKVEEVFRVADHIGGVVVNARQGELTGYSWGSRKFYQWSAEGQLLREKDNPSHFIDYQDGQYAGDGCMITGGIAELPDPAGGGS
ncbi:hypothetical protein PAESOLCIP111_00320 [Paenibacillus solanacearum]|uniref:WG repeat-containing protein n=1 Tax=Paenibacillus solanacearum TaxID=2048548 RepID=A0A916NF10_9BACL|nr:hypothetical protein PAESOLCIP111_00320 [Paenibacillus solanacearum]